MAESTNPFAKLNDALGDKVDAELKGAQATFNELVDLTRAAVRAERDDDFSTFISAGLDVAMITSEMTRDQMLTVMLGAIAVIARGEESA